MKVILFWVLTLVGFAALFAGAVGLGRTTNQAGVIALLWAMAVWFVGLFVLRCPHCGKIATIRPDGGAASPFVGSRCRHCGEEF